MLQLVVTLVLVALGTAYPYNDTDYYSTDYNSTDYNSTDTYNSTGTSDSYYANTQASYDAYNGSTSYEDSSATSFRSAAYSSTSMQARVAMIVGNSFVAQVWEAVKDVMSEVTVNETAAESDNVSKAELTGFITEAFKLSNDVLGRSASKYGGIDVIVGHLLCVDTNHDEQISLEEFVSLLMNLIAGPQGKHPCSEGAEDNHHNE